MRKAKIQRTEEQIEQTLLMELLSKLRKAIKQFGPKEYVFDMRYRRFIVALAEIISKETGYIADPIPGQVSDWPKIIIKQSGGTKK